MSLPLAAGLFVVELMALSCADSLKKQIGYFVMERGQKRERENNSISDRLKRTKSANRVNQNHGCIICKDCYTVAFRYP